MRLSIVPRLLAFAALAAAIADSGLAAKLTDLEHTKIEV
jgi:hypothetical protein